MKKEIDPSSKGLRIALSGSAGTGKTTLGRALSEQLQLPFLEEGMRARIEAGLQPNELDSDAQESLFEELWAEQATAQVRAAQQHGGYVADRSALDFAAAWLQYTTLDRPERTDAWVRARLADSAEHTHILQLPFGVLPLVGDGVRHADPWFQFRFQALVEALASRATDSPNLVQVPAKLGSLAERLTFARAQLLPPAHAR